MTKSPWRNRDFLLVWTGGLVNDLGDWLLLVALPVHFYALTGSGSLTALLFLVALAPTVLFGSLAGALVDRWDLRRTMVITTLLQALVVLPLLTVTPSRIWPVFVVTLGQSILARFNNPAKRALLPRLVPTDQLAAANAANTMGDNIARLVGSPLGGLIVEFGGLNTVVALNGLCFLVAGVLVFFVDREKGRIVGDAAHQHLWSDFKDGLRVIARTRPLPAIGLTTWVSQVAQGLFLVLFVVFVFERLDGGGAEIGAIRGVQAIGGVLGGLVVGRLALRWRPGRLAALGFAGISLVSAATWNAPMLTTALPVYMGLFVVAGVPAVASVVGVVTAAQMSTPTDHMGRMFGSMEAIGAAGTAIGALVAGILIDLVSVTTLLNAQAAMYMVCAWVALAFIAGRAAPHASHKAEPHAAAV